MLVSIFHDRDTCILHFTGPPSWRRVGELSTQIYALGIHKQSTSANIPTWLAETRRRLFCSSYNQDKFISTFVGRPIRISKRHTDVSLPLDLSDEETTGDAAVLKQAIEALDRDGWNTKGRWLRASWIVCSPLNILLIVANSKTAPTQHITPISGRNPGIFPPKARQHSSRPITVQIKPPFHLIHTH